MELTTDSLIWLATGILLLFLEMVQPGGFVLFFFGVGALATFLFSWLFALSINQQLAIFIVSSLISLFSLRGLMKKIFQGSSVDASDDTAIARGGEPVMVIRTIDPPLEGKVKYLGTTWRAVADQKIEEGQPATIVSQDGLIIRVKKNT